MIRHPKHEPVTLVGRFLRLRPVVVDDAEAFSAVAPLDTFRYFVSAVPKDQSPEGFENYVKFIMNEPSVQGFTIELVDSGRVVGSSCLMDIRPIDDQVEIGLTWYAPDCRGTYVNPESKLLLLTYAFEELGCTKVTLKCDDRNEHSKAAITKLGAIFEGTLKRHRWTEHGEYRDTTFYSILCEDWPVLKLGLENRLACFR
jgi:N-acetyltransferase